MKDSFNSNFYITAATVIPLLYITLFLQDNLVQNLAKRVGNKLKAPALAMTNALDRLLKRDFQRDNIDAAILSFLNYYVLWPIVTLILISAIAGIAAEALSLWALYYQSDNVTMRAVVLWSTLGLLVLVCVNPTVTIMRNLYSSVLPDGSDKKPPSSKEEQREEGS